MKALIVLIPITLAMGAAALLAFFWSMRAGQYEDLDGAAERVLIDEDDELIEKSTTSAEGVTHGR